MILEIGTIKTQTHPSLSTKKNTSCFNRISKTLSFINKNFLSVVYITCKHFIFKENGNHFGNLRKFCKMIDMTNVGQNEL